MNPVKAKMIKDVSKYKYSSISEYISGNSVLICNNALKIVNDRFQKKSEFLKYHDKNGKYIFDDVKMEIMMQQEEMALLIASAMQEEYKLPLLCQVVEEKEMRDIFIKRLQKELKVSVRKSKELCLVSKNKMDN